MDAREERGLVIAATCRVSRADDGTWLVPSQSRSETIYRVDLKAKSCTCLDCTEGGYTCKHYYAATFVHKRDVLPDGTVIEQKSFTFTEKKVYRQNWPAYNKAQTEEKHRFMVLLSDLCRDLPALPCAEGGRRLLSTDDVIFALAFKVYCGLSARRFACDLADAQQKGHVADTMHYNSLLRHFEMPEVTPILRNLIARSSLPLRAIETDFAVDSSGFSTSRFVRWYDEKYGVTRTGHDWVKVHLCCGVKTNVVTAVTIEHRDAADSPQFKTLVDATKKNFTIREVSADKGYSADANFEAVADAGGTAFIAFKSNATGGIGGLFEKMFHFYQYRREEFLAAYHKRSNVESTFSMIKAKFRDHVRSKTDVAMRNEVFCKILCHNLCCVIQSQCELGIEPEFWPDAESSPALLPFSAS